MCLLVGLELVQVGTELRQILPEDRRVRLCLLDLRREALNRLVRLLDLFCLRHLLIPAELLKLREGHRLVLLLLLGLGEHVTQKLHDFLHRRHLL